MSIVFRKNNQQARTLSQVGFNQENSMQDYLISNPEIVPIYELEDDARLLVAAREFATNSGPIDALGFDIKGNIYVVETKLFKNPDKRTVVAQAMDYGAALWKHHATAESFFEQLDEYAQKHFGRNFVDKFCDFFALQDAGDALENIKTNLADGSIKFVIMMDKLESRLKDLILYINQNSKFDVYAVELDFYRHDEFEIIIPKLYGAEVRKEVLTKALASRQRGKWDERAFRERVAELPVDQQRAIEEIFTWVKNNFQQLKFGSGRINGSVGGVLPKISQTTSFFSLYSDGVIEIKYWWSQDENNQTLYRLIRSLDGGKYDNGNMTSGTDRLPAEFVITNYRQIIELFEEFLRIVNNIKEN